MISSDPILERLARADAVPLLLVPGLLSDETVWTAQLKGLGAGHAVMAARFEDFSTLEATARAALDIAPTRFALAGHSMGARIALEMVRLAPERVERLALLDTGVHPVQPGEREQRHALLDLGRCGGMQALIDAWLPPMVHPSRRADPATLDPLVAMCHRAGIDTFERQIEALLTRPDARPLLATIRCPTLVATGRQDLWSPVAQHVAIAAEIPGSAFVVFEDSGHMAPFEVPDQVNAALLQWLARPVDQGRDT